MFMLWIKDGPTSAHNQRHPRHASARDHWLTVLHPNANGGIVEYPTMEAAANDGIAMMGSYLDFAVTPFRHDMSQHFERPVDAVGLPRAA